MRLAFTVHTFPAAHLVSQAYLKNWPIFLHPSPSYASMLDTQLNQVAKERHTRNFGNSFDLRCFGAICIFVYQEDNRQDGKAQYGGRHLERDEMKCLIVLKQNYVSIPRNGSSCCLYAFYASGGSCLLARSCAHSSRKTKDKKGRWKHGEGRILQDVSWKKEGGLSGRMTPLMPLDFTPAG